MKTVSDRVRERRLALKLSQPQLAKKAGGITYQAIQQLEAGGGTKHLVAIARALGVSAEWLQDGTGPAPSGKIAPSRSSLAEKLKVLGMAESGADGWSLWNGDVIDMVDRPGRACGRAVGLCRLCRGRLDGAALFCRRAGDDPSGKAGDAGRLRAGAEAAQA